VKVATLDPFRGYGNAIRDELEDAIAVLDAFPVVKLGLQAMEETRRRVQQNNSATAGARTTRSTGSATHFVPAPRSSPNARSTGSTPAVKPATRPGRSPSPGRPTSGSARRSRPRTYATA